MDHTERNEVMREVIALLRRLDVVDRGLSGMLPSSAWAYGQMESLIRSATSNIERAVFWSAQVEVLASPYRPARDAADFAEVQSRG